jgi:serine phosphatase RsbU (regulator of sigma subunit)
MTATIQSRLARLLDQAHDLAPSDLVPAVARELEPLGFTAVVVYVANHEQRALVPLPPFDELESLGIDSTLAGRVYQRAELAVAGPGADRLWLPIRDGVDRLGVLQLDHPTFDDELVAACKDLAALVAQLLVSKNQLTDDFIMARRSRDMTLGAEMRWTSLPPLSFSCSRVSVAAALEPAYEVSGDAFDYALNADGLHLAVFDGVGHDLESALLADFTVAAYRHSRRRRSSLQDTYMEVDALMRRTSSANHFVTAQLAVLDVERGQLQLLNAGHPGPLMVRNGHITNLPQRRDALPIGLGDLTKDEVTVQVHALQPNDRLLFFTDGVTEARAADGSVFGEERLVDTIERACSDQHLPAEAVRRLMHALGEFHGHHWRDDATVMMVEWSNAI